MYTERYMQSMATNPDGYSANSVMSSLDRSGHFPDFTLIHGTADSGLHFQNSALISKRVIESGFELDNYALPDATSIRKHYIQHRYMYQVGGAPGSEEQYSKYVYGIVRRKLEDCRLKHATVVEKS